MTSPDRRPDERATTGLPLLTNPRSERIRAVAALSGRSSRQRAGRMRVDGPQAVREAVTHTPGDVLDVYLTAAAQERYPEIVLRAAQAGVRVQTGSPEVLDAMSPDAQGVVAVATADQWLERGPAASRRAHQQLAAISRDARLVAVLSHVRDPGNAGAVLRAADCAGADAVVFSESSVDVTNPKVVRSTAGSLFHLPVLVGLPLQEICGVLREAGLTVLAADGAGTVELDALLRRDVDGDASIDLRRPTGWVFGNEAWGLSETERDAADAVVRVPIRGAAESLNLATAAAVCLYASVFATPANQ